LGGRNNFFIGFNAIFPFPEQEIDESSGLLTSIFVMGMSESDFHFSISPILLSPLLASI
jgi:hypothetical protein